MSAPLARIGEYITVERADPVPVVRVDLPTVNEPYAMVLGSELRDVADSAHGCIVVDFRQVQAMSSACLRELVELSKRCEARGGALQVCNLPAELVRLLHATRLDRRFGVSGTTEEALEAFVPVPPTRAAA